MKVMKAYLFFNKDLVGTRIGGYTFYLPKTRGYYTFDVRGDYIDFHAWETLSPILSPNWFGKRVRVVDPIVGEFVAPANDEYEPTWKVRES